MENQQDPLPPRYIPIRLPLAEPFITYVIIAVLVIIHLYLNSLSDRDMLEAYAKYANLALAVENGEYYRLFTSMFLHANITHLLFNCIALYSFGSEIERTFGQVRFILVYLLGGLVGSVTSFIFTHGNSIGASGAVFALFGALVAYFYQNRRLYGPEITRRQLRQLGMVALVNLAIGFMSQAPGSSVRIDNAAHIGGALGGLLLAWFITPIFGVMTTLHDGQITQQVMDVSNPQQWRIYPLILAVALMVIVLATT